MANKKNDVLKFWFKECKPIQWFKKDEIFDGIIEKKFSFLVKETLKGKFNDWKESPEGCVALIIILDQFTRNIFRNESSSFSGDKMALEISYLCLRKGYIENSEPDWRHFMLIPMMHSEDINIQNESLPLFEKFTNQKVYNFAVKHRDIIYKFNRFPHRNKILGRKSTEEEITFLKQPGSSF